MTSELRNHRELIPRQPRAWIVRATDPGFCAFESGRALAVNCHVVADITGMTLEEIEFATQGPALARELRQLLEVRAGDIVIATDGNNRHQLLIGLAASRNGRSDLYRFDLAIARHPHTVTVDWVTRVSRKAVKARTSLTFTARAPRAFGSLDASPTDYRELLDLMRRESSSPTSVVAPLRTVDRYRAAAINTQGALRLAAGPRPRRRSRQDGPVSWRDPALENDAMTDCDRPARTSCGQHTLHRYLLEVPCPGTVASGPNLLVVGLNPSCPDDTGSSTVRRICALASDLEAASAGIVNLATRRTLTQRGILATPPTERVGPRQTGIVIEALASADIVILAFGAAARLGLTPEWSWFRGQLLRERERGLVVLNPYGKFRHPSRWATRRRDNLGNSELVGNLQTWTAD